MHREGHGKGGGKKCRPEHNRLLNKSKRRDKQESRVRCLTRGTSKTLGHDRKGTYAPILGETRRSSTSKGADGPEDWDQPPMAACREKKIRKHLHRLG